MKIVTPTDDISHIDNLDTFKVFLSGGMTNPWRKNLITYISKLNLNITLIDPTIDDWEKDVGEENVENEKFLNQTDWEHDGWIN